MSENTPKTVLVTGGNRGIGYEIAKEFQAAGHNVCITYRSGEAPEEFFAVKADVRDADSINEAFKEIEAEFGPVEVLVANAGITRDMLLMRMKESDFTDVVDTNLTGSFRVVQRAIKGMLSSSAAASSWCPPWWVCTVPPARSTTPRPRLHWSVWHAPSPVSWAAATSPLTWWHRASLTPQ